MDANKAHFGTAAENFPNITYGVWRVASAGAAADERAEVTNWHHPTPICFKPDSEPVNAGVAVRRSVAGEAIGPILLFTSAEWRAFLDGAKKQEFDDMA